MSTALLYRSISTLYRELSDDILLFWQFQVLKRPFLKGQKSGIPSLSQVLIIHGSTAYFFGEKSVPLSAVGFLLLDRPMNATVMI